MLPVLAIINVVIIAGVVFTKYGFGVEGVQSPCCFEASQNWCSRASE